MGSACLRRPEIKVNLRPANSLSKFTKTTDYRIKYEPVGLIGNGAFGKVRLFREKNIKELKYAIKTIKKENLPKQLFSFIVDEVQILAKMDHPNIVKYYETYEDEIYINIVMEYLQGEDLFKLISTKKYDNFTEKDLAEIVSCILKALAYIHGQGIVHRDIKPENILFSKNGNYETLKLIDFGLSTRFKSDSKYRVGSPYYMSPEIIEGNFSYKTDVWSVGVILYVMLTGYFPFNGKNNNDVFHHIKQKTFNYKHLNESKCSQLAKDLVNKLLNKNESKRLSVEQALNHPWLKFFLNLNKTPEKIDDGIIKSLKSFSRKNLFLKEALFYIAKLSKDDEIVKLKKAFMEIDKNNTGTLDYNEINLAFEKLGVKIPDVIILMNLIIFKIIFI